MTNTPQTRRASQTPQTPRLLTITEAADMLGHSQQTVRRWIADGRLPACRPGGSHYRVAPGDVERLVQLTRVSNGLVVTE